MKNTPQINSVSDSSVRQRSWHMHGGIKQGIFLSLPSCTSDIYPLPTVAQKVGEIHPIFSIVVAYSSGLADTVLHIHILCLLMYYINNMCLQTLPLCMAYLCPANILSSCQKCKQFLQKLVTGLK